MLTGAGSLARFWREACEQATHYQRMPMLIAHQNQQPTIVLVPMHLNPYGSVPYPKALLGRFQRMGCDVLEFDGMMKLPFDRGRITQVDYPFLRPGELERILGPQHKRKGVKRERMPIKRERL